MLVKNGGVVLSMSYKIVIFSFYGSCEKKYFLPLQPDYNIGKV